MDYLYFIAGYVVASLVSLISTQMDTRHESSDGSEPETRMADQSEVNGWLEHQKLENQRAIDKRLGR